MVSFENHIIEEMNDIQLLPTTIANYHYNYDYKDSDMPGNCTAL